LAANPNRSPFRAGICRLAALLFLLPMHGVAQSPASVDPLPDGKPTIVIPEISASADLKIIAYGDMRFTKESNVTDTNPHVRKWLAEKVGSEKPDLLFLSGDMPMTGANPWDWKDYSRETASWTQNKLRVFPTLGNHEAMEGLAAGLKNYFEAYPELKEHRYYSVLAGSVELIAIDTLQKTKPGSPQFAWLQAQLANIPPQVNFVFFLLHMPLMADVQSQVVVNLPSPEMFELRTFLEEKAAISRARFIAVSGHIHNYERFQHGHITYLVSGGGGARPYPILVRGPQDLYQDDSYPNFHYITLMVHGKRLDATMYRVADPTADQMTVEVKDRFALEAK
jgi:acid phosphatase type 7